MTFPVFASGDVLNASDMNAVGLWKLSTTTFSAVSSVSINNVFTSDYVNYKIIMRITASTTTGDATITMRLRASGTDSSANYNTQRYGGSGASAFAGADTSGTDDFFLGFAGTSATTYFLNSFELFGPQLAAPTIMIGKELEVSGGSLAAQSTNGRHTASTSYDGVTFLTSATSMTGTIWCLGYKP